jgi:hypothetical protein
MKNGTKPYNNHDLHISAVDDVLANDWETRLALEIVSVGNQIISTSEITQLAIEFSGS